MDYDITAGHARLLFSGYNGVVAGESSQRAVEIECSFHAKKRDPLVTLRVLHILCDLSGGGAERLVLELRDKTGVLLAGLESSGVSEPRHPEGTSGRVHELALSALVELGYTARDARSRVESAWKLLREGMETDSPEEAIQAEDVIREALKNS